jgi:hypothetical protein
MIMSVTIHCPGQKLFRRPVGAADRTRSHHKFKSSPILCSLRSRQTELTRAKSWTLPAIRDLNICMTEQQNTGTWIVYGVDSRPIPTSAAAWEGFGLMIAERGEMRIGAAEMRRHEVCTVAPAPDNDVIVAAVVVAGSQTLISTLKFAAKEDWPIDHSARAVGTLRADLVGFEGHGRHVQAFSQFDGRRCAQR